MSNILHAGLVGCGSLAQRGPLPHLTLPDAQKKVRLQAVVDTVAERAAATAARFNVPAWYTSIEAMLAQSDLDLVLILTPIPYHFDGAMQAIAAGKHLYVQKAMTTTLAEANMLLAARDRQGIKLAAAPGFELFPSTPHMRQLVDEGELGRVSVGFSYTWGFGHEFEAIRAGQDALAAIDPSWYYRPGGGPLPDVHRLWLSVGHQHPRSGAARHRAGQQDGRKTVAGRAKVMPVETPDNNLVLMEFATGALVTAIGANLRGSPTIPWGGLGLYGTEGVLEVTTVDPASGYPLAFTIQGHEQTEQVTYHLTDQPYLAGEHLTIEEPHTYCDIMDLVDAILEDRPPRATGEQARHVVDIIEAAQRAISTGQTQMTTSNF